MPKVASLENLVIRGSIIRNTKYGIGIIVYSGMLTKIMKNLKRIPYKVSNIMEMMNKMLYTVMAF
jgi:magnesium-transporting ATPase (P-type)